MTLPKIIKINRSVDTKDISIEWWSKRKKKRLKGTIMQSEKAPINDRLRISKVYRKCHILTIYNFAVI